MKLALIKKMVAAALLLPTAVMALEAAVLITWSYSDLSRLEASRQHATLLTMAGEIASAGAPEEGGATFEYLDTPDANALVAMRAARHRLDGQVARLNKSIVDISDNHPVLAEKLKNLQAAMTALEQLRGRVDRNEVAITDIMSPYWSVSNAYLDLVETLAERVDNAQLLRNLDQLQSMLHGNEAALATAFLGGEYLSTGQLTDDRKMQFADATHVYIDYVTDVSKTGKTVEAIGHWVKRFRDTGSGAQLDTAMLEIKDGASSLLGMPVPSDQALKLWRDLHVERMDFWKQDLANIISDVRTLADRLASQSRLHFIGLVGGIALLLIITVVVLVLAIKGIRFIDRLSRERERLVAELRDAAQTDTLTGVHNRRGFEAAVLAAENRKAAGQPASSVVIFDLDRFKQVNDVHGHDGGDAVLAQVAKVARTTVRPLDLLARHGGEEFVVLLPGSTLDEAAEVAERVRLAIEETQIDLSSGKSIRVTASFGCASHEGDVGISQLNELIKKADLALYAAKFSGRNKVVRDSDVKEISMERREVKFA